MPGGTGNRILDVLPAAARRSFQKLLIDLSSGNQLFAQGERITHAFFPTTAVCSLVVELASGDKAEAGAVGREGFVGVPLVLGAATSHSAGVIQVPGAGYRVTAKSVLDLCRQYEAFRGALRNASYCRQRSSTLLAVTR